jgi:hypothetical protein
MDKTPACYILLGLLIGAVPGGGMGAVNGNGIHGMELGTLAGLLIGWFIAVTALEKRK